MFRQAGKGGGEEQNFRTPDGERGVMKTRYFVKNQSMYLVMSPSSPSSVEEKFPFFFLMPPHEYGLLAGEKCTIF